MALTWGNVKTLVTKNLGRQTDTVELPSLLPLWAAADQLAMERDRNFWFLKTSAYRSLTPGTNIYAVPVGFKEPLLFYIVDTSINPNQFKELNQIDDASVIRIYSPDASAQFRALPVDYVLAGESITVWPVPDKVYTLKLVGWQNIDPPAADSDDSFQNSWITKYPDLYEARLTAKGFRSLQQYDDADKWDAVAARILGDLRAANVSRELGGKFALTPTPDRYGVTTDNSTQFYWTYR